MNRTGLKPIGPIVPNWAYRWSYLLLAVQVNTEQYTAGFTLNSIGSGTT